MSKFWMKSLAVLAVASLTTSTLAARNALLLTPEVIPAGTVNIGIIHPNGPGSSGGTQVIYDSFNEYSGFFSRPVSGRYFFDDVETTLDNVNGGIIDSYDVIARSSITFTSAGPPVVNCPAEAATAFDAITTIWRDFNSPPDVHITGEPLSPIAGTTCNFIGIPKAVIAQLSCPVGVPANGQFWVGTSYSSDCAGWAIAGLAPPSIGFSDDFFARSFDATGSGPYNFFFFGGCPPVGGNCASFLAQVLGHEAGPDACCDTVTDLCSNENPGDCQGADQVYTEGVLCNDLPDLCSDAGACCDTLTGDCSASFASLCSGIFEEFTAGALCADVTCVGGDNVPTVSQWGMIALTVILLSGLTIKFGRRRAVTA
ncbi:MAG: hypothetical protein HOP29_04180 [Phycisphaerales bacterium]|nr:hypothetical protein [Phycisphaerales bacterium]